MSAQTTRALLADEQGATLIELLVVLSILGIVLGGLTTLFVSATTSHTDQSNRVQAQQNARLALDSLRREIHCASAITPDPIPMGGAALIKLTLGPYCQQGGTTLTTNPLTIPAAGTYSVGAANTGPWATAPYTISVGATSGAISCATKTATSFTGCTGGIPGTYTPPLAITGTTTITWCTKDKNGASPPAAASSPYSLWRFRGDSCSGVGRKQADYLTDTSAAPAVASGKVFVGYTTAVAGELRALTVALPVDLTPNDTRQRYTLRDDIALRNSRGS